MLPLPFFDWPHIPIENRQSKIKISFGGVPDSTFDWSAPLPVESRGSLVKPPAKKIIGNNEEMPLAA
jgi:hypothetical protein